MNNTPPAAIIEMAIPATLTESITKSALKELRTAGRVRLAELKKIPGAKNALERGYLLGLQTAAQSIATMPAAVQAGVEL